MFIVKQNKSRGTDTDTEPHGLKYTKKKIDKRILGETVNSVICIIARFSTGDGDGPFVFLYLCLHLSVICSFIDGRCFQVEIHTLQFYEVSPLDRIISFVYWLYAVSTCSFFTGRHVDLKCVERGKKFACIRLCPIL